MAVRQIHGKASWGKASTGFSQVLIQSGKVFTEKGAQIFTKACERWLQEQNANWPRGEGGGPYKSGYLGGNYYFPWYTGTLHDSMATMVLDHNKVLSIRYMQDESRSHARADQTYKGRIVVGRAAAEDAVHRARYVFLPGLQMKLVIGAPYARELNDSPAHAGYLDEFQRDFATTMSSLAELNIKNIAFRAK